MLHLPTTLQARLDGMTTERDTVGCSGAGVYKFSSPTETLYLKVEPHSGELEREYQNLLWLQGRLPVPEVVAWATDAQSHYLLLSEIKGEMAFAECYLQDPVSAVALLAEGIARLRSLDIAHCPIDNRLARKLNDAAENIRLGRVDTDDWEPDSPYAEPEELLAYLHANRPAREELCFAHGDYCLPNILGDGSSLRGLIDMGRAGVADIWQDIALCIRSMRYNFKTDAYDGLLLETLGVPMDEERLRYYILLDELF